MHRVSRRGRRAPGPVCSAEAVATENVLEGLLELLTEARVDDGVEAAVEVAQPESNFEDSFRGSVGWEVGAFGDTERMKKKKKKEITICCKRSPSFIRVTSRRRVKWFWMFHIFKGFALISFHLF